MANQKEINDYLKQVKKHCAYPLRKKLTRELESNLSDYLEENPGAAITDIVEHFGSPEKFADEYILAMDESQRRSILRKSRRIKRTVFIAALIFLLIITMAALRIVSENSKHVSNYYNEEITNGGIIE